jgi:signal transduction histidine kinase
MTLELGQIAGAWPFGISLAAAAAAQGLWTGRRRSALNEALHELRRPLQALALAAPADAGGKEPVVASSMQMAAAALARLEREINGEAVAVARTPIFVRPLLESAVCRWRGAANRSGGTLTLRWLAGEAMVEGDRCELSQALDNLLVNAIEHGGPEIVVEARIGQGRLRVAVLDSGCGSHRELRRPSSAALVARLSGRRRRGHGLRVVRRTAAAHGGEFRLRCRGAATVAALYLPLLGEVEASW